MEEYRYMIYEDAKGWGSVDTLYLIKPSGVVKKISNAERHGYFRDDRDKAPSQLQLELIPGAILSVPELCPGDIEKEPKQSDEINKTVVSAYILRKGKMEKLWRVKDCNQIDILNMMHNAYNLAEGVLCINEIDGMPDWLKVKN